MIASHHGNLEVVKVLLSHGARVDVFDEVRDKLISLLLGRVILMRDIDVIVYL